MTGKRSLLPARIPPFTPVPTRSRRDGWSAVKQAEFIGMLAQTGCVSAAAEFVGMSRETAYRLRKRAGAQEFALAWDAALARPVAARAAAARSQASRKVTQDQPWRALLDGRWRVVMRKGKYCGSVREAPNSALLGWLGQLDRSMRQERKALRAAQRSQPESGACVFHPGPAQAAGGRSG